MVLVVLFLVVFLGLWGQASRQIGSMIRVEEARARRVRRDASQLPAMSALARSLAALELGFPPTPAYVCRVEAIDGSTFAATFQRDPGSLDQWIVSVEPTSDDSLPQLDPANLLSAPPPTSP
jgi:hypothetical protein